MELQRRVTQKDVARAAGVHPATVSLALRNSPSIPEKTRVRVRKIAAKLKYAPDPMMAALASYRSRMRSPQFHGTLAWLANTTETLNWRNVTHFTTYLAAAKTQAESMGYRVETFDLGEMGVTPSRAASIAQARGIKGILVCPQPQPDTEIVSFPWERFSAVTFGYSLTRPLLHSVAAAHYRATMRVMRELHARGHRRIGWAFRPEHDARVDHNFLAGYLTACEVLELGRPLPLCPDDALHDGSILRKWLREHRPDALVTGNAGILPILDSWGVRWPRDLAVACPLLTSEKGPLAGVVEDNVRLGEAAVEYLIGMIQRGERGIPGRPQRLLAEGVWTPGATLRDLTRVKPDGRRAKSSPPQK
jgi:LacI family transcriptional regulator/LacI family repressor for deo operon, udp, cdd, tsx, nupC, and nupG